MLDLIPTMATSFATAMAANSFKGAKGPAQALDDIMTLVGFEKLHFYADKKRAENEVYIKDYKEKIAQELVEIPEENIQEPPLSIVGPALEASKFYIEEEELREMFAKLIAASMDKSKNKYMHPSYVEIIKQLSPHDAILLKDISNSYFINGYPIIQYTSRQEESHGYSIIIPLVFLSPSSTDIDKNAIAISNLNRLGLLDISFVNKLVDNEDYNLYDSTTLQEFLSEKYKPNIIEDNHGSVTLTPLAKSFIKICLP